MNRRQQALIRDFVTCSFGGAVRVKFLHKVLFRRIVLNGIATDCSLWHDEKRLSILLSDECDFTDAFLHVDCTQMERGWFAWQVQFSSRRADFDLLTRCISLIFTGRGADVIHLAAVRPLFDQCLFADMRRAVSKSDVGELSM